MHSLGGVVVEGRAISKPVPGRPLTQAVLTCAIAGGRNAVCGAAGGTLALQSVRNNLAGCACYNFGQFLYGIAAPSLPRGFRLEYDRIYLPSWDAFGRDRDADRRSEGGGGGAGSA